jgi:hypothetical protein
MMMENSRGGEKLSSNLVMTLFFMCHVSSHKQLVHKIDMLSMQCERGSDSRLVCQLPWSFSYADERGFYSLKYCACPLH